MSKKFRLNPKDATYKGCYQAKTKDGKQFRGAHTTENIHKVLPTKHRRLPGQEAHCG
jgi:hypothetical protein